MAYFFDFSPGEFSNNVISALQNRCDYKTLIGLSKKKLLYFIKPNNILTHQSICFKGLESYAEATGVPLSYFFFGSRTPPVPGYSSYDSDILWYIDHLSQGDLLRLRKAMQEIFPNAFYHSVVPSTVHGRMLQVLGTWHNGAINDTVRNLENTTAPELKIVQSELARYVNSHYSAKFCFASDALIALSNYTGISLHWLFQLNVPLFCNSQLADEIFDYYTLMQPEEQKSFCKILTGKMTGGL